MDIRELIPLHALGLLDDSEARAVETAIATDPALAAELDTYRDSTHSLAAVAAPVEFPKGSAQPGVPRPSSDVRARLIASIGRGRFEPFAPRLARLFDVTLDQARELLGLVETEAAWEGAAPGVGLIHIAAGAACAGADCGLVRLAAGATFPWHAHRGEELVIVLVGRLRDPDGRELAAGDEVASALGSEHELVNVGDGAVIYASRADGGIDVRPR
jgi:quercetin dioxygenase-like cupin family protein